MADVKVILEILIDFILDLQDKLEASETYRNSLLDRLTLSEELLREAAEAEVSAMAVTMAETNLAMVDLQRRLATAEGLLTTITGNWESGERFTKAINLDWNGVVVQPERIDVTVSREWYERAKEVCNEV
jgi:Mg-chelatase subunit ChlI